MQETIMTPPKADVRPKQQQIHNTTISDPYAWLRDSKWQDVMRDPSLLDSDIRAYLEAENAYTMAQLADTDALQESLFTELKGRIKEDDQSVPDPDGPYAYFYDFIAGGQYPRLLRQPRDGGEAKVLLDANQEAKDKPYWDLGASTHSPNHRLLAYSVDEKGSELYTIKFRDLESGVDLEDTIPDTRGDVQWANDSTTVFYVRVDDNQRPLYVYRHTLGTPANQDTLVYEEKDSGFFVGIEKTLSGRFITINAHDHTSSEVHLIDADAPAEPPRRVAERRKDHEYSVAHRGDALIILTNTDGAEDFQVCTAPVSDPGLDNWTTLVPHLPGRLILDIETFKNFNVRLERDNGLPRLIITDVASRAEHAIAFAEEAYALGMQSGLEFDTDLLRFTYSSMTTPAETYDYNMRTRDRVLRKRRQVPSGHNPQDYVTQRLQAPAKDGETVPISLLYHKDTPLDGTAPVLLYGYGAYGISIPASFVANRLSLADRGFVYAIAHVRGGKDKGYRWYTDGKLAKKANTFTDFIAAGEHLVSEGITSRGRIIANGGSAGGMLMGAIANMAPDLFLGIIADVPFVDVLNTMLDDTLPLTPPEWLEWGNPISSSDDFAHIQSYSPYDNVTAQPYPHILALAGLTDPRVTYWEPAKWVAKLRTLNTGNNMILLHTNMEAGHGGASGRFSQLKEVARDYAFALKIAGAESAIATT
jgi:oligopeptidase B